MHVAMHFAAAAQVLLQVRVQGSGVRGQSLHSAASSIDLTMAFEALRYIQNQEPETFTIRAEVDKADP